MYTICVDLDCVLNNLTERVIEMYNQNSNIKLGKKFNKTNGFIVGMILLPIIFMTVYREKMPMEQLSYFKRRTCGIH